MLYINVNNVYKVFVRLFFKSYKDKEENTNVEKIGLSN